MLDIKNQSPAEIPASTRPRLVVAIDTEEEFDWSQPHDRNATGVTNIRAQVRAHELFERFGIVPTYFVDFSVASQPQGVAPLKELCDGGACLIGTHLHPWVNPPHDEDVNYFNSYAGNLPAELEKAKLARLTDTIAGAFGRVPAVYRAGRYGVGPNTTPILHELDYKIDMSVVPRTDMCHDGGPDFSACPDRPYWFGPGGTLLEIPLSVAYVGPLWRASAALRHAYSPRGEHLHLPGVLARARLLERIRLTPEGITLEEQMRLTRALYSRGHRVFSYNYHSPSLAPGHTPYVRSESDLAEFLERMERYFEFFFDDLGGEAATPMGIHDMVAQTSDSGDESRMSG